MLFSNSGSLILLRRAIPTYLLINATRSLSRQGQSNMNNGSTKLTAEASLRWFSSSGGMGSRMTMALKQLAMRIAEKTDQQYSIAYSLLRCHFMLSLRSVRLKICATTPIPSSARCARSFGCQRAENQDLSCFSPVIYPFMDSALPSSLPERTHKPDVLEPF